MELDIDILIVDNGVTEESNTRDFIRAVAEVHKLTSTILPTDEVTDYVRGHGKLRCAAIFCNEAYDQTEAAIKAVREGSPDLIIFVFSPIQISKASTYGMRLREISGSALHFVDSIALSQIESTFESLQLNQG